MKSKDKIKTTLEKPSSPTTSTGLKTPNNNGWGGARPNTGRKPGVPTKITFKQLMEAAENRAGKSFCQALMEDWHNSVENPDLRFKYNQLILNKVVADQHHIEVDDTSNLESKALAFVGALQALSQPAVPIITVDPDTDPE